MTRYAFVGAILLLAASPAFAAQRVFTVTDFDKVQVDGPYEVTLATGRASAVRATGDRELIDALDVQVQGSTLRIRRNQSAWGSAVNKGGPVTIALTTKDLRTATVNGAGHFSADKIRGLRFDVALSGSGAVAITGVEVDTLNVTLMGAGRISIAGKAKSLRTEIRGSGNLEADGLTADDAQIFADSAGTIRLAALRSAKVTSSASGDVEILGSPACTVKMTGTGSVRCGGK